MKYILSFFAAAIYAMNISAQTIQITGQEWLDPAVAASGAAPLRTEFISYDVRSDAEKRVLESSPFYLPLDMASSTGSSGQAVFSAEVNIPYMWLDRELFLHVEGLDAFYVEINGRAVGYGEDKRTPTEFNISNAVKNGRNSLTVNTVSGSTAAILSALDAGDAAPAFYIYSQPKLRVEDYRITARPDSTDSYGILTIELAVANSYNSPEKITFGYDIYSPQGKLQYYDMKEITIAGQGRDTVIFNEFIYGTPDNLWSAENPALYYGMLTVRRDGRMTEYIPYRTGFYSAAIDNREISRNGKKVEIKAVRYNAVDSQSGKSDLFELKKKGFNTVFPDYPQPAWFYDLCDQVGMYVIDRANVNSDPRQGNRNVGGAVTNDPQFLGTILYRNRAMHARSANHVSIIGWSPGADSGNGYNMYKAYQWLKNADSERAVVYNDAEGQWNSDMDRIPVADPTEILSTNGR